MLLSTKQISQKWGISQRRIAILCKDNRVYGAQRVGANWGIPDNAIKPIDARIKKGKYIKTNKKLS
ncbi:MAG: DNA-binding protein [Clostridia bacterium]